ncbi:hypothetical protein AB834_04995 [PVC group bacterium (ex Bugula neritina AB1)]|nr:hypothetical protein AB834_04995 [PVC group bacterium (ex Bugula neritina AB1)]
MLQTNFMIFDRSRVFFYKIFWLVFFFFVSGFASSEVEELFLWQDELDLFQKEQKYLFDQLTLLKKINLSVNKQIQETSSMRVSFQDLFSKNQKVGKVEIRIYHQYHEDENLFFQKYYWPSGEIFSLNGFICNLPNIYSKKSLQKKIKETLLSGDWMTLRIDEKKGLLIFDFKEKGIHVEIVPSLESQNRVGFLDSRIYDLKKKIDLALFEKKSKESIEEKTGDNNWGKVFLGQAPKTFVEAVLLEMEKARATSLKSIQFLWYLQILKHIKTSGYFFEDSSIERDLMKNILDLMPTKISTGELQDLLQKTDGIQKILLVFDKAQKADVDLKDLSAFIDRLRGLFIIKKSGNLGQEKSYYLRQGKDNQVILLLTKHLKKHEYFLQNIYKKHRDVLIEDIKNIRKSSLELSKAAYYSDNIKMKYKRIVSVCDEALNNGKKVLKKSMDFRSFFTKSDHFKQIEYVLAYIVFQDYFFYIMKEGFEEDFVDRGRKSEISQKSDPWASLIQECVEEISSEYLNYIGFGQSRFIKQMFRRQNFLRQKYVYEAGSKYLSSLDKTYLKDGNVLKLRENIFHFLEKGILNNEKGATLWAKIFLFPALFRSLGVDEIKISICLLVYFLENFSESEKRLMFQYFENHLIGFVDGEDIKSVDFDPLLTLNIIDTSMGVNKNNLNDNISAVFLVVLNFYQKTRKTKKYRSLMAS